MIYENFVRKDDMQRPGKLSTPGVIKTESKGSSCLNQDYDNPGLVSG